MQSKRHNEHRNSNAPQMWWALKNKKLSFSWVFILSCSFSNLQKNIIIGYCDISQGFQLDYYRNQTLKPSARRHLRWASIHFSQAGSPCSTMHSSLSFLVSGQAQHIFFFSFESGTEHWLSCDCREATGVAFWLEDPTPIYRRS